MFKVDKKFLKTFEQLTPNEQIEWVEKQTEKVIKRLPTLKRKLARFNDVSDEFYNMSGEDITLIKNVYKSSNFKKEGVKEFISELKTYGDMSIKKLINKSTKLRIESFLDNVKKVGGEKEYNYAKQLINGLSLKEKTQFVKSKYFFDTGDLSSENFVKFLNEHGVSVGIAKLEGFMLSIGKDINIEKIMYYDVDTNIKLGRPKKNNEKKK